MDGRTDNILDVFLTSYNLEPKSTKWWPTSEETRFYLFIYLHSQFHIFLPVTWWYNIFSILGKINWTPPPRHVFLINKALQPLNPSLFVLFSKAWLIKVQAMTWLYLEANYRDRQVPNAVKQIRSEMWGCICPHQDEEWRDVEGGERQTVLFVGCYLEKQRDVSLFTPLIPPLCLSTTIVVSSFVSASVTDRPAACGIHHLPAPVSYQAWTDLSMTQLPLLLPTVSLNCTLIKLGLLIMRA